jgi:hypothetical protein
MQIVVVNPAHVCNEWALGAHQLSEACEKSAGEITGDQLKMLLARGERTLLAAQDERGVSQAWAAIQVQQLPNIRVMHVYSLFARGNTGDELFEQLADIARKEGCSEIRGCVNEASERMWRARFGAERVYTTIRVRLFK